ncbi:MAG: hypothetical protein ACRD51_16060 [Candidatus Acidiferrum sp.]
MKTAPPPTLHDREQLERNALRLLCSLHVTPGTRFEICRVLHSDNFLDSLRRTVFEEIQAAGSITSKQLRAWLPARMLSRGFPGFYLDKLLVPMLVSEAEIEYLFECTLCLLRLGRLANPVLFPNERDV